MSAKFDGKQVVQIYLKSGNAFEPKMQLLGFVNVRLKAGEKKRCSVCLEERELQRYISGKKCFYEGVYSLCVATSCQDIVCEEEFTLCDVLKGVITKETQLGDVLNEETYREIVLAEMRSILNFGRLVMRIRSNVLRMTSFYENRCMVYPSVLSRILMRSYLMIKKWTSLSKN